MPKKLKKLFIKCSALLIAGVLQLYRKFRPIPPRIYFCYNQSIHHIYHSIFVAIELSNLQNKYEVVVFSTSREATKIIEEELASITNRIKFIKIWHPGYNKIDFNVNWFVLLCRLRMHHPAAVVVTDFFDNVFRQLLVQTFWIYLPHGLINREFGDDPHMKDYNLVILAGDRDRQEFQARIGPLSHSVIAGYSKLDYFRYHKLSPPRLFKESKPVIMYNPHFEKKLSSFFDQGPELLEALARTDKYNIIFMPHPDLARKYSRQISTLKNLPGIILADRSKINLEYMAAADVYITDVSSSVFEWLYFNKPVLFFNTKKISWLGSRFYSSWTLGQVVEDVPAMLKAIEYALIHPEDFENKREEFVNKAFANRDKNVSKMIVEIIWQQMNKTNP